MSVALGILTFLLGLVLLLALPVHVVFRFEGIESFRGWISVRWLFGLVRFKVQIPNACKESSMSNAAAHAAKARMNSAERNGRGHMLALLRQARFRRRIYRLFKDVVRAAHLRQLRLRIRLGLGDPADTGRLWAFMGPLNALAQNLRSADVQITPEFMEAVFEFKAHGQMRLVPLQFLVLAIGFALSLSLFLSRRTVSSDHA